MLEVTWAQLLNLRSFLLVVIFNQPVQLCVNIFSGGLVGYVHLTIKMNNMTFIFPLNQSRKNWNLFTHDYFSLALPLWYKHTLNLHIEDQRNFPSPRTIRNMISGSCDTICYSFFGKCTWIYISKYHKTHPLAPRGSRHGWRVGPGLCYFGKSKW